MKSVWQKLNLPQGGEIVLLDAPDSFSSELTSLEHVRVHRDLSAIEHVRFALTFVQSKADLEKHAAILIAKAAGDALLWFAYPKGGSKRRPCDINRDRGWEVVRKAGWDTVRQVAIDEDWSALRFRRVEFIGRAGRRGR